MHDVVANIQRTHFSIASEQKKKKKNWSRNMLQALKLGNLTLSLLNLLRGIHCMFEMRRHYDMDVCALYW